MFHTIDDSKEALGNFYHVFCFACLPFLIISIILFNIFRIGAVFTCICLVHSIPWAGGVIWKIVSMHILYHMDNAYWPVVYDWCVDVYDETVQIFKHFETGFKLTRALGNMCSACMMHIIIVGIALVISFALREASGIPMAIWAVGVLICLEPWYRKVSSGMETKTHDLYHAWLVYKGTK